MTHDEIRKACTWTRDDEAELTVRSPAFERDITIHIFVKDAGVITDNQLAVVDDFLAIPKSDVEALATMLWHDAVFCFEAVSYDYEVPEGADPVEVGKREFSIQTPADALSRSTLKEFSVYEQKLTQRYGTLVFECPWSDLVDGVVRNGRIVDVYDNGVHLGWYEPGAKYDVKPSYLTRGENR